MKYLFAITFILAGAFAKAQDNFLAYKVTGDVTVIESNKVSRVKVGKVLAPSVSVRVGKNANILLVCGNSSSTVSLQEGTHKLSSMTGSCVTSSNSITTNYLNYVWWQFTHPGASESEEGQKNRRGAGAVMRGCLGVKFLTSDTIAYSEQDLVLKWKVLTKEKAEFALFSAHNSPAPILKIPVTNGSLRLATLKDKLEVSTDYYWTILLDGNDVCERKLLQVWGPTDLVELADSVVKNQVAGMDQAESNYMMGYIMEQNHLIGEAYIYYKLAAKQDRGNKRYKKTVKRFRSYL